MLARINEHNKSSYMKILNCAYSFMDNYAQHAGVSILSLFENNQEADEINIYIIDYGICQENKEKLISITSRYGRTIHFYDLETISSSLNIHTNFCRSTYGKLFLSRIPDVDKMLVFDCDTVVSGSLLDLLNVDMTDTLVAGVQDTVNPYFVRKIGLSSSDRYINCGGVIIMNLSLWRQKGIENLAVDYILEYNGNPPFVDQGTINHICKEHIKVLPPEYNVINPMFMFPVNKLKKLFLMQYYYSQEEIEYAKSHPKVIHFTAELYNRPWALNCNHPLKTHYLENIQNSPWNCSLRIIPLSKNCKIQKWIYKNCPFFVYLLMIRFITLRHMVMKRIM